ncbi:hypothetical protein F5883DRAFT_401728, partial [Diaporthe sp. PMI_573]
ASKMAEAAIGRRMLGEIEETSLDEILSIFRTSLNSTSPEQAAQGGSSPTAGIQSARGTHVKSYPIQDLDRLVAQHFRATQSGPLSLSGRHFPLIYLLVATLIAAPHNKALIIIDVEARFDITRVTQCAPRQAVPAPAGHRHGTNVLPMVAPARQVTLDDLEHVYVYRPAHGSPSHIREVLSAAEHHMIYSKHASIAREWWGSIVIGGGSPVVLGPEAAVTTGWRGWLRVDREEVRGFDLGMSIEEALLDRDRRQRAVNDAGWTANCVWGGYTFDG